MARAPLLGFIWRQFTVGLPHISTSLAAGQLNLGRAPGRATPFTDPRRWPVPHPLCPTRVVLPIPTTRFSAHPFMLMSIGFLL
jgi:hypothetical protein